MPRLGANTKLFVSAVFAYLYTSALAVVGYLEGLDGGAVNWITIAWILLGGGTAAGKDYVTHRAKPPANPNSDTRKSEKHPKPTPKMVSNSGFKFSQRSISNLQGVHGDLRRVANMALKRSPYDFGVTSGVRTIEQQKVLVDTGRSQAINSRHLSGHAIDIAVYAYGAPTWDIEYYKAVADVFKAVGEELGVPVEWGGDWTTLVDGPHFQLPKAVYS